MAFSLRMEPDGRMVRRDFADHAPGEAQRARLRELADGPRDLGAPWNEGFSFTHDEFELLRRLEPQLFDGSPADRLRAWKAWARTSAGRSFRVR